MLVAYNYQGLGKPLLRIFAEQADIMTAVKREI